MQVPTPPTVRADRGGALYLPASPQKQVACNFEKRMEDFLDKNSAVYNKNGCRMISSEKGENGKYIPVMCMTPRNFKVIRIGDIKSTNHQRFRVELYGDIYFQDQMFTFDTDRDTPALFFNLENDAKAQSFLANIANKSAQSILGVKAMQKKSFVLDNKNGHKELAITSTGGVRLTYANLPAKTPAATWFAQLCRTTTTFATDLTMENSISFVRNVHTSQVQPMQHFPVRPAVASSFVDECLGPWTDRQAYEVVAPMTVDMKYCWPHETQHLNFKNDLLENKNAPMQQVFAFADQMRDSAALMEYMPHVIDKQAMLAENLWVETPYDDLLLQSKNDAVDFELDLFTTKKRKDMEEYEADCKKMRLQDSTDAAIAWKQKHTKLNVQAQKQVIQASNIQLQELLCESRTEASLNNCLAKLAKDAKKYGLRSMGPGCYHEYLPEPSRGVFEATDFETFYA